MNRAIFLDRDGVINKLPKYYPHNGEGDIRNYVSEWKNFEFEAGALDALILLADTDYYVLVVSNQSCIGRGLVEEHQIQEVFIKLRGCTRAAGIKPDKFAYEFCPHKPEDNCACRKPKPGMIYSLAVRYNIDLGKSWMIGDMESDIEAGLRAGVNFRHLLKIDKTARNWPSFGFTDNMDLVPDAPLFTKTAFDLWPYSQWVDFPRFYIMEKPFKNLLHAVQYIKLAGGLL